MEIKDLLGETLKVGDKVSWGEKSSTSTAYLNYGQIVGIYDTGRQTEVIVKILKSGHKWQNYDGNSRRFVFPRIYNNLIKVHIS